MKPNETDRLARPLSIFATPDEILARKTLETGGQEKDTAFWLGLNERSLTQCERNIKKNFLEWSFWANGCTLNVCFPEEDNDSKSADDESSDHANNVARRIRDWETHANITFNYDTSKSDSHLRIEFIDDVKSPASGSSYVGTNNKHVRILASTMKFFNFSRVGGLNDQNNYNVLHEFGKQRLSELAAVENILAVIHGYLCSFDFDPRSIMGYIIPRELLMNLNGKTYTGADMAPSLLLSEGDKQKIAAIYPKPAGGYFDLVNYLFHELSSG